MKSLRSRFPSKRLIVILVLLDQVTKFIAIEIGMAITNHGVSFGFFPSIDPVLLVVLLFSFFLIFSSKIKCSKIGMLLFVSGAISNLLDRVLYGGVRDFLPIPLTNLTNNLADWFISGGVVLIILSIFINIKPIKNN